MSGSQLLHNTKGIDTFSVKIYCVHDIDRHSIFFISSTFLQLLTKSAHKELTDTVAIVS